MYFLIPLSVSVSIQYTNSYILFISPHKNHTFPFSPSYYIPWALLDTVPSIPDAHQSSAAARKAASNLILAPDTPNAVKICMAVPITSRGTKMGKEYHSSLNFRVDHPPLFHYLSLPSAYIMQFP